MSTLEDLHTAVQNHAHFKEQERLAREHRDRLALKLLATGYTWRGVANICGFTNSHIAYLRDKAAKEATRNAQASN